MAAADITEKGLVGQTLGEFFVRRLLGKGGMGEVYEADQTALQRRVALKVLREELVKDPTYLARFQAEARTIARIQHPNIVSVITIGERGNIHYMAMEFVDGRNLRDHIARQGALDEKEVVAILKKVAGALQRAHDEGVVHRDVKPENILITRKTPHRASEVKVADFGLARRLEGDVSLTRSGITMGTPLYMSPEQIRGQNVDPRSDIYSLGVTAYHMLAGEPPYNGDTPMAVAVKHLQGTPTPLQELRPDLAPDLCRLVERMMAVHLDKRIASAGEIVKELNRIKPGPGLAVDVTVHATFPPTGPTVPIASVPTVPKARLSQTLSQQFARVRDVVGDKRRMPWVLPLSLAFAVMLGGFSAWFFRERDPFTALATAGVAQKSRPKATPLEVEPSDPEEHFQEANARPAAQREAALWGVLDAHQAKDADQIRATLNAAVELYKLYRDDNDESRTEELIEWLGANDRSTEQATHARLFRGFLHARRGERDLARKTLDAALKGNKTVEPEEFDKQRLKSVAEEFFACMERMKDSEGKPTAAELTTAFWRRFTPAPAKGPKGKP